MPICLAIFRTPTPRFSNTLISAACFTQHRRQKSRRLAPPRWVSCDSCFILCFLTCYRFSQCFCFSKTTFRGGSRVAIPRTGGVFTICTPLRYSGGVESDRESHSGLSRNLGRRNTSRKQLKPKRRTLKAAVASIWHSPNQSEGSWKWYVCQQLGSM